jgi:hypothetical protein
LTFYEIAARAIRGVRLLPPLLRRALGRIPALVREEYDKQIMSRA